MQPLHVCTQAATATESPTQSSLLIIVLLDLDSSLLALLRPLSRLSLLLRNLDDLLVIIVVAVLSLSGSGSGSGSGSLLALLLLGSICSLLLGTLRNFLVVVFIVIIVASEISVVLSLSGSSLALPGSSAIRALGVYTT